MKKSLIALIIFQVLFFSFILFQGVNTYQTRLVRNENRFIETGRLVEAGGFSTYVREYGDPSNPVVVLIHGFGGSSWDYHEFSKQLSEDYYVVAMDQLGYGLSEKSIEFDYQRRSQAQIIEDVIQELGLDPYAIAGHSMGGDVVLNYVDLYPNRVEKLILFAAAGLGEGGGQGSLPGFVIDLTVRNYWIQRLIFEGAYYVESFRTPEVFDPMFYQTSQIPTPVFLKFTQVTDSGSLANRLSSIEIETLIVWGEEDTFVSVDSAYVFSEQLPNNRLVVYPGIGHMPFQEALDQSLQDVRDFLAN